MNQIVALDDDDKEMMADILTNIEDWATEGEDLKSQFYSAVKTNNHALHNDFLNYVFDSYFGIEVKTRSNPRFNAIAFIEDKVESFNADRLH